jgi:hypothetical protein
MPTVRRRVIVSAALAGLTVLTGCTGGGSSMSTSSTPRSTQASPAAPAQTGQSAAAILAAALAALRSGGSVHLRAVVTISSHTEVLSQDSGTDAGRQVFTIDGKAHATVLVVGGVGYIEGDADALTQFFGFSPALARELASRWISFHRGESAGGTDYQQVTAGVTLADVADELQLTGPLTLAKPTGAAAGQAVVGVHGDAPDNGDNPPGSTMTLYVASKGRPLPVTFQIKSGAGQGTYTFSRWGEPFRPAAPPNPIPAPSLSSPGVT